MAANVENFLRKEKENERGRSKKLDNINVRVDGLHRALEYCSNRTPYSSVHHIL